MNRIHPEVLRAERERKGWSLKDLARRSRVDAQSIHRIEKGDQKRNRKKVISDLAKALGVSEGFLTGADSTPQTESKSADTDETFSESQLNLRVSDGSRNALALVARRYGVSHAQIVEIAPLLFLWTAEKSLQQRRVRLSEVEQKYEELDRIGGAFPHLHARAFTNMNAEETLKAEADSIEARDIFGTQIVDYGHLPCLRDNYEESEDNPMTMFLKELVGELGDVAEFGWWYSDSSPYYSICKEEVLNFVGGDKKAADRIHSGHAPLHKLPKELRESGKEVQRAEWARKQGEQWLNDLM